LSYLIPICPNCAQIWIPCIWLTIWIWHLDFTDHHQEWMFAVDDLVIVWTDGDALSQNWAQIGADWHEMGQIRDIFRSDRAKLSNLGPNLTFLRWWVLRSSRTWLVVQCDSDPLQIFPFQCKKLSSFVLKNCHYFFFLNVKFW